MLNLWMGVIIAPTLGIDGKIFSSNFLNNIQRTKELHHWCFIKKMATMPFDPVDIILPRIIDNKCGFINICWVYPNM